MSDPSATPPLVGSEHLPVVGRYARDDADAAPSDETLLAAVRESDVAAFRVLFFRYHRALCSFAYRYVGIRAVAEELVQDALLYLWQRRGALECAGDGLRPYLFASVRNAAVSHLRHRRVEEGTAGYVADLGPSAPPADREAGRAELALAVRRAVATLPDRQRQVFTLHRQYDMSYAEIAQVLGISPRTVEAHMGQAFKALRKALAGFWIP
jgi:RNA polymerase sigma-70 factor, ECF subfamily